MGAAPAGAGAASGSDPLEPHRCNAHLRESDFLQPQQTVRRCLSTSQVFASKSTEQLHADGVLVRCTHNDQQAGAWCIQSLL